MDEIERKFIIGKIPKRILDECPIHIVEHAYLNIDPEIRIRSMMSGYDVLEDDVYVMTIKTNGGIIRKEMNIVIGLEQYRNIQDSIELVTGRDISDVTILKEYYTYDEDGYVIEVNLVDKGKDTEFIYAEVEFGSVSEAEEYDLPKWFTDDCGSIIDVTYQDEYKMKNYWNTTRLSKK